MQMEFYQTHAQVYLIPGMQRTLLQEIERAKKSISAKQIYLWFNLKILDVSDAIVRPDEIDIEERNNYKTEEKLDLLLSKLFELYETEYYYPVKEILTGNGIILKRDDEANELAARLERSGLIEFHQYGRETVRITLDGVSYVEQHLKSNKQTKNKSEILELYNINIVGDKSEHLFKVSKNDILALADAFNSKALEVFVSGKRINIAKTQSIKIFSIKDFKGLTNELEQSGRLDSSVKKLLDIGNWNFEKHLQYGDDVTSKYINAQVVYSNIAVDISNTISEESLRKLIKSGEGKTVEFKSTLRWDLKLNSTQKHIAHSVGKTIAAFLNSEGGTLFIGVSDDGNILGLDADFNSFSKENKKDEFQKHFDILFQNWFGNHLTRAIKFDFIELDNKICAAITIPKKWSGPVYLIDNGNEIFYVRRTSGTVELKPSEMVTYIRDHWK